jgi:hypothetical protein
MRPKLPQVAWTGDGRTGHVGRGRVFAATRPAGGVARLIEDEIDFARLKPGQFHLELEGHQRLELDRQDLTVPVRLLGQAIVGQDIGALLDLAEVGQPHGWHLLDAEQLCGSHPPVTSNDLPFIVDQDGIAETKFLNALGDLADLLSGVGPRIARVRPERFDR